MVLYHMMSLTCSEKMSYTSLVVKGEDNKPIFKVIPGANQEDCFEASSASAVWKKVFTRINEVRDEVGEEHLKTTPSGHEMFGFANTYVSSLIEGLEGAEKCDGYIFQSYRERGHSSPVEKEIVIPQGDAAYRVSSDSDVEEEDIIDEYDEDEMELEDDDDDDDLPLLDDDDEEEESEKEEESEEELGKEEEEGEEEEEEEEMKVEVEEEEEEGEEMKVEVEEEEEKEEEGEEEKEEGENVKEEVKEEETATPAIKVRVRRSLRNQDKNESNEEEKYKSVRIPMLGPYTGLRVRCRKTDDGYFPEDSLMYVDNHDDE